MNSRIGIEALNLLAFIKDVKPALLRMVIDSGEDGYQMRREWERLQQWLEMRENEKPK